MTTCIDQTTPVTALLANGAFVNPPAGESLSSLLSVTELHEDWIHDLSMESILNRGGSVVLLDGIGIELSGSHIRVFEDSSNGTLGLFPSTAEGYIEAFETIDIFSVSAGAQITATKARVACLA